MDQFPIGEALAVIGFVIGWFLPPPFQLLGPLLAKLGATVKNDKDDKEPPKDQPVDTPHVE